MTFSTSLPMPPSVNSYYRTFRGRMLISAKGREYRNEVAGNMLQCDRSKLPFTGRIRVNIAFYPPDKRRRDLDNLYKGLLDALTHAGVWQDDSQIDDLRIVRMAETEAEGMVFVQVESIGGDR